MLVPRYDTGAWSLYDQFGESNLNYHELLTEFLQHLCERTSKGLPLGPPTPLTADGIYCTTAQRFTADLTTPPVIALLSAHAARGHPRRRDRVAVEDLHGEAHDQARLEAWCGRWRRRSAAGTRDCCGRRPNARGSYSVTLSATDLAGNTSQRVRHARR